MRVRHAPPNVLDIKHVAVYAAVCAYVLVTLWGLYRLSSYMARKSR